MNPNSFRFQRSFLVCLAFLFASSNALTSQAMRSTSYLADRILRCWFIPGSWPMKKLKS